MPVEPEVSLNQGAFRFIAARLEVESFEIELGNQKTSIVLLGLKRQDQPRRAVVTQTFLWLGHLNSQSDAPKDQILFLLFRLHG